MKEVFPLFFCSVGQTKDRICRHKLINVVWECNCVFRWSSTRSCIHWLAFYRIISDQSKMSSLPWRHHGDDQVILDKLQPTIVWIFKRIIYDVKSRIQPVLSDQVSEWLDWTANRWSDSFTQWTQWLLSTSYITLIFFCTCNWSAGFKVCVSDCRPQFTGHF